MQSSDLERARAMRAAYATKHERDAFTAGYRHTHGIARHYMVRVGGIVSEYGFGRRVGERLKTVEEARYYHRFRCYIAESQSRCYSPWEHTAHDINSLEEDGASSAAWEAYDAGVAAAIEHDLAGYADSDYEGRCRPGRYQRARRREDQ